jgi:hypothetical protein
LLSLFLFVYRSIVKSHLLLIMSLSLHSVCISHRRQGFFQEEAKQREREEQARLREEAALLDTPEARLAEKAR